MQVPVDIHSMVVLLCIRHTLLGEADRVTVPPGADALGEYVRPSRYLAPGSDHDTVMVWLWVAGVTVVVPNTDA